MIKKITRFSMAVLLITSISHNTAIANENSATDLLLEPSDSSVEPSEPRVIDLEVLPSSESPALAPFDNPLRWNASVVPGTEVRRTITEGDQVCEELMQATESGSPKIQRCCRSRLETTSRDSWSFNYSRSCVSTEAIGD